MLGHYWYFAHYSILFSKPFIFVFGHQKLYDFCEKIILVVLSICICNKFTAYFKIVSCDEIIFILFL